MVSTARVCLAAVAVPLSRAAAPRRLLVKGSSVSASDAPDKPLVLKGFTWWYQDIAKQREFSGPDETVTQLFPGVNLARLVMDHWLDTSSSGDCHSNDEASGFVMPSCLEMFDAVIDDFTKRDIFVVITARAASAAGDGGDGHTVFTNDELRSQMISMWKFLAKRYTKQTNVAGFEVMSEPRTDNKDDVVHKFQEDACAAVWSEDAMAVCFVGPAKFYDRWHLGPEYLVSGGPVIYAANFFVPNPWVTTKNPKVSYGDKTKCCNVGSSKDCPNGCDEEITLDAGYLRAQLKNIDDFRAKHNVPLWIDQWGVHAEVGEQNQRPYLQDVLQIFEQRQYHWSYWIFRDNWGPPHCPGNYEIFCQINQSHVTRNEVAIEELGKYLGAKTALLV